MPFTLRPMEPRDVPVVAEIDRLSFPTPWPASAFRRELQRERATYTVLLRLRGRASQASVREGVGWLRRLFGSTQSSRVIGYVGFRLEHGGAHITTIALHPDWRGRGLGDFLLLVTLDRLVNQGIDGVTLEMRPSNDVAHKLYRKYGFHVIQSRREYYRDGEDAWVMTAHLSDEGYQQRLIELRKALKERLDRQGIEVGQITGDAL